jgi:hypothetical protein
METLTRFRLIELLTKYFSTLLRVMARDASAPTAVASSGAIIPEKVLQHNRKTQERFGGKGTVLAGKR